MNILVLNLHYISFDSAQMTLTLKYEYNVNVSCVVNQKITLRQKENMGTVR